MNRSDRGGDEPNTTEASQMHTTEARVSLLKLVVLTTATSLTASSVAAGTVLYFVRERGLVSAKTSPVAVASSPVSERFIQIEPMVINLTDQGGHAYLRLAIAIGVSESDGVTLAGKKGEQQGKDAGLLGAEAAMRDVILNVAAAQSAESMEAPNGKDQLKAALKAGLAKQMTGLRVLDVYFTEFLVQR